MNSMTGYGQAAAESEGCRVVVTLRGVNHRFLDLSLRLPEEIRASEGALQRLLSESIERGRVELSVEVSALREPVPDVRLNTDAAAALARAAVELEAAGVASGQLTSADLLRMPEVLQIRATNLDWDEDGETVLLAAAGAALDQLLGSRQAEGRRLETVMCEKLEALEELVGRLQELRPAVQGEVEEALRRRVGELLVGRAVDEERLAQEIALLIDRSNISEELERLSVHLEHMREILSREGALGKRLDFLVQEIFRELNTLSAKCRGSEMTRLCVDAKVLCEEAREQLRNVE